MIMTTDRFFATLFQPVYAVKPEFQVLFLEKKGNDLKNPGRRSPWANLDKLLDGINAQEKDGYFHCGVDLPMQRALRLRKVDVTGCCFLWADVDKALSDEELVAIRDDADFAPSIIVTSGRGYHLYWLLDTLEQDRKAIENKNRWLAERFGGDHCGDVTRILRVPGTYNWKDKQLAVKVVSLKCDGVSPDPKELCLPFRYKFEQIPEKESATAEANHEAMETYKTLELGDAFLSDPRFCKVTWLTDAIVDRSSVVDRSDRDWKVASKLTELGFTENEVFSVLTHPTWAAGDKGRDNQRYARYQTSKVKEQNSGLHSFVAMMEKAFTPEASAAAAVSAAKAKGNRSRKSAPEPERDPESLTLRERLLWIHADVIQVDGSYRKGNKNAPVLGGEFGEKCARAYRDCGYRFVRDDEYDKNFIADRKGKVWEAKGKNFESFVKGTSGYSAGQKEFAYITAGIEDFIRNEGEKIKIGRWFHYDQETAQYYILADDLTGLVYVVDEHGSLSTMANGAGDVFLRPRVQAAVPLVLTGSVTAGEGVALMEKNFTSYIAGSHASKRFMTCFMLASVMCYGTGIMTLPLLYLTGPSGKGKSHTLGLMTCFLFGYYQLMLYTVAAAYRSVSSETIVAIDDKEKISEGLEEYLLLSSTGVHRGICNLEDQTAVVNQKAHVINALTAIGALNTLPLRRRALVIEVNKALFPSEEVLRAKGINKVIEARNKTWSGLVHILGGIIKDMKSGEMEKVEDRIYSFMTVDDFRGHAGFLSLMVTIEKELCKAVGREFNEAKTIKDFTDISGLNDAAEVIGRDPLVLCLEAFFEQLFNRRAKETFHLGDVEGSGGVQSLAINRGFSKMQWDLTTSEENARIEKKLGSRVRGVKASANGWVSIFSSDTKEFGRTITSPTSLGIQFKRVKTKEDFPFWIEHGKSNLGSRIWYVFQKIE